MADLGGYEGVRQAPLPGLPDLPGRPIRRSGGGLCPTVLRRTEADGGVSSHPAPAVRCCLQPHRRLQPLRLLVAEGALLRPPPPLQLGHNSSLHNGRSMELATGKRLGPFCLFRTSLPSVEHKKRSFEACSSCSFSIQFGVVKSCILVLFFFILLN